jgi:hypothetical protein
MAAPTTTFVGVDMLSSLSAMLHLFRHFASLNACCREFGALPPAAADTPRRSQGANSESCVRD